jgi:hypothetical protein
MWGKPVITLDDWKILESAGAVTATGMIASAIITQWVALKVSHRSRVEAAKSEAYTGFIEAYRYYSEAALSVSRCTDEAMLTVELKGELTKQAANLAHWRIRLWLVGSPEVVKISNILVENVTNLPFQKDEIHLPVKDLAAAMRKDLKWDAANVTPHL